MKRILLCFWSLLLLSWTAVSTHAAGGDMGSVSGIVRDGRHAPVAGAEVTLSSLQNPGLVYQASSGASGKFHFADVAPGEYTVSTERNGYKALGLSVVRIASASLHASLDLVLVANTAAPVADADVHDSPAAHAAPQFQASGIRGLIDPGGYSVSTDGAASGLLRGMADLKRSDVPVGANAWPCSFGPALRQAVADHPDQAEANRRLGQFYAAHDEPAQAIPLLQKALRTEARDDGTVRELAVAWLANGQFEKARMLLAPLAERSGQADVHRLLARADEGSGMFQSAAAQYRIAGKQAPSEESAFGVGYELVLAGSLADAVAVFDAGVRQYPQSIQMLVGAGTAQFFAGNPSAALQRFLDAAEINPADPRPYPFLASASAAPGGESQRVLDSFKRHLEQAPDSADSNYFYALALSRRRNAYSGLIEILLRRSIELNPNLAEAHLLLANLSAERGDYKAALPEYLSAIRLDPGLSEAHYRVALVYKRLGDVDKSAMEMQTFRRSQQRRAGEKQGTGDGVIDLTQFISVMNPPEPHLQQQTQCPASAHQH